MGVNANASNPHYEPTEEASSPIAAAICVLLDMWAKLDRPGAVVLRHHLDRLLRRQPHRRDAQRLRGGDAARATPPSSACRRPWPPASRCAATRWTTRRAAIIESRGFGAWFTHRTGHSIGQEVHGNGANMDNFENHDERRVSPWTCFSIEPGVYLPEFGVRSEIDMFVGDGEARVTGEIQHEIVRL